VGGGGQGVEIVGHPCRDGRRSLVRAADHAPTSDRRLLVAQAGRPLVEQRSPAGRGSQPVCVDRLLLCKLRLTYIF
jgi:hypothetical protein